MVGIYKIQNRLNNKVYIGQSIQIEERWKDEIQASLRPPTSRDTPLIRALRKYGENNFEFNIIDECSKEELDIKEVFYIKEYNSLSPNGYNIQVGGHSNRRINYDLFREIVEDNPSITNAELAEKLSIHIDTVRRLRKRLGLPKRKYEYELSLSKIYAHKSEIVQQYNQNFSISIISKKLNVDEVLLAKVVNDEWKIPKHQHIYKNNKRVLLYDKKDGHFVELTTKADIIERFGHFFRFSSLDNKRKSDLGFVVRFYKEDFPLVLKKLESGRFEFWEEEG